MPAHAANRRAAQGRPPVLRRPRLRERLRRGARRALRGSAPTIVEIDIEPFYETARLLYDGPWVAERYHHRALAARLRPGRHSSGDARDHSRRRCGRPRSTPSRRSTSSKSCAGSPSHTFRKVDALALPTAPTVYTIKQVLADPIQLNSRLGTYTNFVNLLDLCGLALPASMTARRAARSASRCWRRAAPTPLLAEIGRVFHADTGLPLGALNQPQPPLAAMPKAPGTRRDRGRRRRRASLRPAAQRRTAQPRRPPAGDHADRAGLPALRARRQPAGKARPAACRRGQGHSRRDRGLGAAEPALRRLRRQGAVADVDRHRRVERRPQRARAFWSKPRPLHGARDISSFGGWRAFMAEVAATW